jgi:adenylate kinase
MILILMGAPGAGKGTQAEHLKVDQGFLKISTGDLFRREIGLKTDLGRQVEEIINQGGLVSDEILTRIMKNELDACASQNVVLDGFPRTVRQAEWLAGNANLAGVIHIDAEREELIERLRGRLVCSRCEAVYHTVRKPPIKDGQCDKCGSPLKVREDDSLDRVLHRLDVYLQQTKPVLEFYKGTKQYFRVDGNGIEETVSKQIDELLSKIGH